MAAGENGSRVGGVLHGVRLGHIHREGIAAAQLFACRDQHILIGYQILHIGVHFHHGILHQHAVAHHSALFHVYAAEQNAVFHRALNNAAIGEHILSGILHQMFGAENVGFHIGAEAVRMDTSVPISPEGLRQAELAANRIVWQDVPVLVSYPTREELAALVYRSKKEIEGQVRIVTIPGADVCACCGTHTRTTGQVGQIKILASENYKGGVRLSVVCGARALEAAQAMRARQADIGALLSAKADQTAVAVHRVYDEYTALKFTHFGVCSQLFDALAQLAGPGEDAIRTVPGLDPDGLHRLAVRLTEATTGLCAALTPTEKGTGYCIAQADGDVRALTKALNAALNGRGGGKPGICQGSCAATPEQVERFLKENNKL